MQAQSYVPKVYDAERTDDDRFLAKISGNQLGDVGPASDGFIENIELEIQWWTLIGQAVEIYNFKWSPGGKIYLGDDGALGVLERYKLAKYPDLQKRFDNLQPSGIKLSFKASFHHQLGVSSYDALQANSPNYYLRSLGDPSARRVTTQFLTGKPNKMQSGISPGSPRDWQSFLDWEDNAKGDPNVAAKNTFDLAKKITFSDLTIEEITLPRLSALSILKEYNRRENIEDPEGGKAEGKKTADNNQKKSKGSDPFSEKSDFGALARKDKTFDPFADMSDLSASNGASTVDVFASVDDGEEDVNIFIGEVKSRDGKMGVVGETGEVLIPFEDWRILSYSDGAAKVQKSEYIYESCNKDYGYTITITQTGLVEAFGGWSSADSTDRSGEVTRKNRGMVINSYPSDWSYDRINSAKRREKNRLKTAYNECRDMARTAIDKL